MNTTLKLVSCALFGTLLSACAEDTGSTTPSSSSPTPEDQACLTAVAQETGNSEVRLLSSEFSEAGTLVKVGVGPDSAPWQCIAYADGATDGIMSLTNSINFGSASIGLVSGVSTNVGATEFTRMPCGASSTAIALVKPSMACLVMQ